MRTFGLGFRAGGLPGVPKYRQTAIRYDACLQFDCHRRLDRRPAPLRLGIGGTAHHFPGHPMVGRSHRCRVPAGQFRSGHWPGDFLPHRTLHQSVLVLLPEHWGLSLSHIGCSHPYMEHPSPAGGLHGPQSHCDQPHADRSLSARPGERLRGVPVLRMWRRKRGRYNHTGRF